MCFSSKKSSSKPTPAPVTPDVDNAPAANPDLTQQKIAATSSTVPNDPLGQSQLGG